MPISRETPGGEAGARNVHNEISDVHGAVVQAGVITGGVTIHLPLEAPTFPAPRQLPPEVFGFVDRTDQLATLDAMLAAAESPSAAPVMISAVSGTAGVGKTALAVHWAHRVRDQFPDGHLYIDLNGYGPTQPLQPAEVLDQFLRALGVDGNDIPAELAGRAARFRTLVDQRRILLVLDNAGAAEQVRPLLPGSPSCFVVVTSRDALSGLVAREGARRVDLDLLPVADATALLRTLVGSRVEREPEAVDALIQQCARLPLALRIAAELVITRHRIRIADLAAELADERQRLDLLDAGDDPYTAVRAVFSWSYRHLPELAARAFRLAGLHPGRDFDPDAVSALVDVPPGTARRLIDGLVRAHLFEETTDGRRYQMHDLLRVYAAELTTHHEEHDSQIAALGRLFDHYLRRATAAHDAVAPHDGQQRQVTTPTTPTPEPLDRDRATVWLEAERANLIAIVAAAGNRWPASTIGMANAIGHYLDSRGYHSDGLTLHTHALAAARYLDDRTEQSRALNNLGIVHRRRGQYQQALEHHQQALTIARKTRSRIDEGNATTSLGITYRRLGLYRQALDHHQQALAIHRSVGNPAGEASALTRLAMVYERLRRNKEALDHFGQALMIYRATGNRTAEGRALNNLGIAYRKQGRHQDALAHLEHALITHRATGNHIDEAHALNALGVTYQQLERYQVALDHLEQALDTHRAAGNRVEEGHVLNNLGVIYRELGRHHDASDCHRQALDIAVETINHELGTETFRNLGETARAAGDLDQAADYLEQALSRARESKNRYEEARANDDLAKAYQDLGRGNDARDCWQEALAIYTDLDVPDANDLHSRLDATHDQDQER